MLRREHARDVVQVDWVYEELSADSGLIMLEVTQPAAHFPLTAF